MKFILLLGDYRNKHVEIIIIHEGYILQNYEIFLGFLKKNTRFYSHSGCKVDFQERFHKNTFGTF